jgi:hypothetical protein
MADEKSRKEQEDLLDKALADSFPSSDPVSFTTPETGSGSPKDEKKDKK